MKKARSDERGWEHFAHGADIGICGFGPSLDAAFEEAGKALSAAITTTRIVPAASVEIACEARSIELLFVEWLNAVIYEMAERRMVFGEFAVRIRDKRLRGTIRGEPVDPAHHQPTCEPKGATFTELAVYKDENGIWKARCVIDV